MQIHVVQHEAHRVGKVLPFFQGIQQLSPRQFTFFVEIEDQPGAVQQMEYYSNPDSSTAAEDTQVSRGILSRISGQRHLDIKSGAIELQDITTTDIKAFYFRSQLEHNRDVFQYEISSTLRIQSAI